MDKKSKKILKHLLSWFTLASFPMVALSCGNKAAISAQFSMAEAEIQNLRDEYHKNNSEYNSKIKEFGEKIAKLKKEKKEDELLLFLLETKLTLKKYIDKYNELLSKLREAEKNSKIKTIKLFHTNDEHGRMKYDDGKYSLYTGFQELNNYINKQKYDLLVSGGDMIQGLPLSDSDKGKTMARMAKSIGYDSVNVGNHEFDYGLEQILEITKETSESSNTRKMPFISSNVYYKKFEDTTKAPAGYDPAKAGTRVFKPYIIKTLENGVKAAVIGMTTPEAAYTSHPKNSVLVEFRDPAESAKNAIKEIQEKEPDVNFIVATTHLGIEPINKEWGSKWLANKVEGIDLIVDGHSHTLFPIEKEKDTYISQTENYTKYLSDLDITFNSETGKIIKISQSLRNIHEITAALGDMNHLLKYLENKFDKENKKIIFQSPFALKHTENIYVNNIPYAIGRTKATGLGILAADSLAWEFIQQKPWEKQNSWDVGTIDNTVGLMNGGGLRKDLKEGNITREEMLAISPYGNRLSVVRVKGSTLIETFAHGATKVTSGGFAQWSDNVSYSINVQKQIDEKTKKEEWKYTIDKSSIKINNKAINPDQYYYVATNDFILAGGDGYEMLKTNAEKDVLLAYESDAYLEILVKFIKKMIDNSSDKTAPFAKDFNKYSESSLLNTKVINFPQGMLTTEAKESNK